MEKPDLSLFKNTFIHIYVYIVTYLFKSYNQVKVVCWSYDYIQYGTRI